MENQAPIATVRGISTEKEQWTFGDGSVATVERVRTYEHTVSGEILPVSGARQFPEDGQDTDRSE